MREPERYREELELLNTAFPQKNILTVTDAANYCGRSRKWCREHFTIGESGITKCKLAKELAKI